MSNQGAADPRLLRFVGGEIAAKRRERGLTQEDLSWVSGIHRTTVSLIERGACDASVNTLSYLYFQLDCTGVVVDRLGIVPELEGRAPTPPHALTGLSAAAMVYILGNLVRARRSLMGLRLGEVARISGLHLNSVWNFEKGLVCPTISSYFRVLRALEVSRVGHSCGAPFFR